MFKVNNRNTRTTSFWYVGWDGVLFCSSTMAFFEESRWLSYGLDIHFAPIAPGSQNLLDLILDNSKVSDEAPVIDVVSRCSTFLD